MGRMPKGETAANASALVVGRDRVTCAVIAKVVADAGYVVVPVMGGTDALRQLAGRPFNLLVAEDGGTPISGLDLWQLLAGHPTAAKVPFVLVIDDQRRVEISTLRNGPPSMISPPFNVEGLKLAVERARNPSTVPDPNTFEL
jgi:CheY-like chemotaxis protein